MNSRMIFGLVALCAGGVVVAYPGQIAGNGISVTITNNSSDNVSLAGYYSGVKRGPGGISNQILDTKTQPVPAHSKNLMIYFDQRHNDGRGPVELQHVIIRIGGKDWKEVVGNNSSFTIEQKDVDQFKSSQKAPAPKFNRIS